MKFEPSLIAAALLGALLGGTAIYLNSAPKTNSAYALSLPTHHVPPASEGGVVLQLCDGVTSTEVEGLRPGEAMSHQQALAVTRRLMDEWQRKHPQERWEMAQVESSAAAPSPVGSSESLGGPGSEGAGKLTSQQGDTYASFHERDLKIWQQQTDAFVNEGNKIFHSDKLLGGTIGVSCDMCHPDAANTHPETYPKYQEQLQRVALLRDMINWCIENPVKGRTLTPDDPKLRALEAYILAQRKSVPLAYGKH
jgi:thiosulfate dehydrogenase/tetrathionate reductase SoxA/TsdA-like protein